jgi:hypothetical protein
MLSLLVNISVFFKARAYSTKPDGKTGPGSSKTITFGCDILVPSLGK